MNLSCPQRSASVTCQSQARASARPSVRIRCSVGACCTTPSSWTVIRQHTSSLPSEMGNMPCSSLDGCCKTGGDFQNRQRQAAETERIQRLMQSWNDYNKQEAFRPAKSRGRPSRTRDESNLGNSGIGKETTSGNESARDRNRQALAQYLRLKDDELAFLREQTRRRRQALAHSLNTVSVNGQANSETAARSQQDDAAQVPQPPSLGRHMMSIANQPSPQQPTDLRLTLCADIVNT